MPRPTWSTMPSREGSSSVSLVLANEKLKANHISPALVTFPDVKPNPSTAEFALYTHSTNSKAPAFLLGQSEELEFRSDLQGDEPSCTYMLGQHSSQDGTLTLFPARFFHLRPVIKRLREADEVRGSDLPRDYYTARTSLGTTFGSKRARRALQAAARSRIDPETMSHLETQITTSIAENSTCLPTVETQAKEADANRPIPPFNKDATKPKDVYHLNDVVTSTELNAIPLTSILAATTAQQAARTLPSPNSKYVTIRLQSLWSRCPGGQLDKKETKRLRILVYINYLLSIRQLRRFNRETISRKLFGESTPPIHLDLIVDGILSKFTESAQGADGPHQHKFTSFCSLKLLSYIAVLCLIHDEYSTRVLGLADDLQEPINRVINIFSSLGCKLTKLPIAEVESLDDGPVSSDPKELTAQRTVAKLVVPLVFPPPRIGKRRNKA